MPLLERLKFESIYFSNLDEFFMVRIGSLADQELMEPDKKDEKTGMNAHQQIHAVFRKVREDSETAERIFHNIQEAMRLRKIEFVDFAKLSRVTELLVFRLFQDEIKPLLSPQIVDRHHPFPFLKNKEQYVAISFESKSDEVKFGIIPVSHLPAYFILNVQQHIKIVFTADIVCYYAHKLYSKHKILEKHMIRVTRNADISADEDFLDYDVDFRGVMQELLKKRNRLSPVRLQISSMPTHKLSRYLCEKLEIQEDKMLIQGIPLDFSFGFDLYKELRQRELCYQPMKPFSPVDFSKTPAFRYLAERDLLLAFPFHSMKPFIDLLYEAAEDKSVVSIKISLYRLANHSKIASALAYAAEKGKEVICILELRARFDEQSNIDYAKVLEDSGCTVLYGLSEYKVHAKLCLITRRIHHKIGYITQIGTGNYNEKTAELYTDLSLITMDEAVGKDANQIFHELCMGELPENIKSLWAAPKSFKSNVLRLIQEEIEFQRAQGEGYIAIKVNSLNDMEVMEALVQASQAGVTVELYVRGICCILPGIEGWTEKIIVKSIVGRLLEHSRIFIFGKGSRRRVYIGSGDLLNRNTTRRVEVFVPVENIEAQEDILHIMEELARDDKKAWRMLPDGSYKKNSGPEGIESQLELYRYFAREKNGTENWLERLKDYFKH